MKRPAASEPFRPVLLLLLFHMALWAVYGAWYTLRLELPIGSYVFHFPLLIAWIGFAVLLGSAVAVLPGAPDRRFDLVARVVVGAGCLVLLGLYAVHLTANLYWGRNMILDVVVGYAANVGPLLSLAMTMPSAPWYLAAVVGAFACVAVPFLRARALSTSMRWLGTRLGCGRPGPAAAVACLLAAAVLGGGATQGAFWVFRNFVEFRDEPFTALMSPEAVTNFGSAVSDSLGSMADMAAWRPDARPRRNVVVILSDAFRADHASAFGYGRPTTPFLDSLVRDHGAQTVRTMLTACPETVCGVMALFASKEGSTDYVGALNLPTLLGSIGYRVNYVLTSTLKRYYELSEIFLRTGAAYVRDGTDCTRPFQDDDCALEHLSNMPPHDGTPSLIYVHLHSTHQTGDFHPEYDRFGDGNGALARVYDARVLQSDDYMRRIVGGLREKGYLDDAIVVVTGDHGEGLNERGLFGHLTRLNPEFLHVPFVWWDTRGQTSLAERRYGGLVDVSPTILDALGLTVPASWKGTSLLRPPPPSRVLRHRTRIRQAAANCSAVSGRDGDRLGLALSCGREGREEFYDLTRDPGGVSPVPDVRGDAFLERLGAELGSWRSANPEGHRP